MVETVVLYFMGFEGYVGPINDGFITRFLIWYSYYNCPARTTYGEKNCPDQK